MEANSSSITTNKVMTLNVASVITVKIVETSSPIPDIIGAFFEVIPNIIPKIAPIKPIARNVFPAALEVVVLASAAAVNPAAQAPEQTAAGSPNTPPIIPNTIGAFDVPLTFAIINSP